jgi:hypothetical protein
VVVTITGRAQEDVEMRIENVTGRVKLYQVWKARNISITAKLRIFVINVKSALFYTCESLKVKKRITKDLHTFIIYANKNKSTKLIILILKFQAFIGKTYI